MKLDARKIIISDLHGCFRTLIRLLNKIPEGSEIIFAGDLIDRGPRSKEVVEFAMKGKIPVTMGNHEDLALAFSKHKRKAHCAEYYDRDVWLENGGLDCLESFETFVLPEHVLDWMQAMPAYIEHDNLLISHTGYGKGKIWFHKLWTRHSIDAVEFPDDGLYRVFGHTQEKDAVITDKWAMIDTGCAYYNRGMGNLTAFEWPSRKIFSQYFDEKTPAAPNFTVENGILIR